MFSFKQLTAPIFQAPMAGGVCTAELVAAVSNAGGVGGFGFAYSTPEKISQDLAAARALTTGPINANFFVFQPVELPNAQMQDEAVRALKYLPHANEFKADIPSAPFYPDLAKQLAPIWSHRPAVLTFHFGVPPAGVIDQAHALGIAVGISATSLAEALAIQQAGADFIVAQGIEAGGHRGIFDTNAPDEMLSMLDLTKQLTKECSIPIVSAGGIMDGADIQAVLHAGASAAQLGTAFLCCDESGASPAHKSFVMSQQHRPSVFTKSFSGRPARGIENEFITQMENQAILPFPLQNTLTGSLRQWASKTNNGEYQSLWAGAAFQRARSMPAQDLIKALMKEISTAPH